MIDCSDRITTSFERSGGLRTRKIQIAALLVSRISTVVGADAAKSASLPEAVLTVNSMENTFR